MPSTDGQGQGGIGGYLRARCGKVPDCPLHRPRSQSGADRKRGGPINQHVALQANGKGMQKQGKGRTTYLASVGDGDGLDRLVSSSLLDVLDGLDYVHSFNDLR